MRMRMRRMKRMDGWMDGCGMMNFVPSMGRGRWTQGCHVSTCKKVGGVSGHNLLAGPDCGFWC